jgi:hypothetical protein
MLRRRIIPSLFLLHLPIAADTNQNQQPFRLMGRQFLLLSHAWVECIAEGVPEEVECHHGQGEYQTRNKKKHRPRFFLLCRRVLR